MYSAGQFKTVLRDCPGILIPAGSEVVIPEGTDVQVTQSLGGSFTVHIGGNLVRVAGRDADALGLEPPDERSMPENPSDGEFQSLVEEQLKNCFDPEIPINIMDLGLVYKCDIRESRTGQRDISIEMTLTAPGCGMGEILVADVKDMLQQIPSAGTIDVELVFDPPWSPERMSDEARLQTGMYG